MYSYREYGPHVVQDGRVRGGAGPGCRPGLPPASNRTFLPPGRRRPPARAHRPPSAAAGQGGGGAGDTHQDAGAGG